MGLFDPSPQKYFKGLVVGKNMEKDLEKMVRKSKRVYKRTIRTYKRTKRAVKLARRAGFVATSKNVSRAAFSFSRYQLKIRPRIKLFSKFLVILMFAFLASSTASHYIEANKAKVVVYGQQILVARENEAGPSADPIVDQYIEVKKSPFEFSKPLEVGSISQGFSVFHPAFDIAGPLGEDVHPVGAGNVEFAGTMNDGHGKVVVVNHGDGLKSLYAHLGRIDVGIGNQVEAKTKIGTVGLTGRTTGPHVHLEILNNDRTINPGLVLPFNLE